MKTNRHKVNKRRDVSDAHLEGRHALLVLDQTELGDRFPLISAAIAVEIEMIVNEIALRAAGKSKPSASVNEDIHEFEGWDNESVARGADVVMRTEDWSEDV